MFSNFACMFHNRSLGINHAILHKKVLQNLVSCINLTATLFIFTHSYSKRLNK